MHYLWENTHPAETTNVQKRRDSCGNCCIRATFTWVRTFPPPTPIKRFSSSRNKGVYGPAAPRPAMPPVRPADVTLDLTEDGLAFPAPSSNRRHFMMSPAGNLPPSTSAHVRRPPSVAVPPPPTARVGSLPPLETEKSLDDPSIHPIPGARARVGLACPFLWSLLSVLLFLAARSTVPRPIHTPIRPLEAWLARHVVPCQEMSCHVRSCPVTSCQVVCCHVRSCPVTSRQVRSCHVTSCHDPASSSSS